MPSTLIHISAHRTMAESVCRENPWTLWQNWNPISRSFVGTFIWLLLNPDTHLSILYQFTVLRDPASVLCLCVFHIFAVLVLFITWELSHVLSCKELRKYELVPILISMETHFVHRKFFTSTRLFVFSLYTLVPPYLWEMQSKTPSGCLTPQLVLNPICSIFFPIHIYP